MSQKSSAIHRILLEHGLELEGQFSSSVTWETPAKVYKGVILKEVLIGSYSYVAPNSELNYVSIGRYCSLGPNGKLFGSAHPTRWLSSHPFTHRNIFTPFVEYEPTLRHEGYGKYTVIGHDVWTGANVTVLPGVKIGNGAVIGAGAVVAKDVPDYAVVVGNPGRVVKYRFDEGLIERLLRVQWWRFDLPRHMGDKPGLPFDRPETMLDYIEEHSESLPKFDGVRTKLFRKPEGLALRTIQPSAAERSDGPHYAEAS